MRPIRLELQAFGSFPGTERIDFEAIAPRGLFVVAGDTGAGKTTIFDAMCWALYGEMPLKEPGGVRSHHADDGTMDDTETYVELTFECDGNRYMVRRTPKHSRAKKHGSGTTTVAATARLVKLTPDGTEPLSTKAGETSELCAELVGLDAEQFQRVVLLPQGEFAQFLLAKTKEREELLGTLFGGQVFHNMVEHLKARRSELESEVHSADIEIAHQLDTARRQLAYAHIALGLALPGCLPLPAGPEPSSHDDQGRAPDDDAEDTRDAVESAPADRALVGRLRNGLKAPLAELDTEVARLKGEVQAAATVLEATKSAAERFDDALRHLAELERLDAERESIESAEAAASASQAARPVVEEANKLADARKRKLRTSEARDAAVEGIASAFAMLGVEADTSSPTVLSRSLAEQQNRHRRDVELLAVQQKAVEEVEQAEGSLAKAVSEREECQSGLAAAAERVRAIEEVELPGVRDGFTEPDVLTQIRDATSAGISLRQQISETEADLGDARQLQRAATYRYESVFEAFVATEAPRLAATLTDGEACPVCGSVDHPSPATNPDGATASSQDLQQATKARERADGSVSDLVARLAALRGGLGADAELSLEELRQREATQTEQLAEANRTAERIKVLEAELDEKRRTVAGLEKKSSGLEVAEANDSERLEVARTALREAQAATQGVDPDEVDRRADTLADLERLSGRLDQLFTDATAAAASVADCEKRLAEVLAGSRFGTVDEAVAALLDPSEERRRIDAAATHSDSRTKAETALRLLSDQGVPGERPDPAAAGAAADAARKAHEERLGAHHSAVNALAQCDAALGDHDELETDTAGLRAAFESANRAYLVCRDGGALDMSLKRWILTRELDRVTAAANVHLQRMTAHRYSLHRRNEVIDRRRNSGLDLEVMDANTGRTRAPASLSGGEQFQASLALALGLADVVSHGGSASGKRFEALFVDEGFGSLDPRSLEEAIEALHQLHASGRMVGAITHVEAMKQQLHVGIEVTRLPEGGGSTLTVHP